MMLEKSLALDVLGDGSALSVANPKRRIEWMSRMVRAASSFELVSLAGRF